MSGRGHRRTRRQAGVTLIEVLIAVSLLALLSVAMLMAMRVSLSALGKANAKLMENRRVAGAQRIIEQEIEGFMPAMGVCASSEPGGALASIPFFQGEPSAMRLVSTFSLQQGWRGQPQILEIGVISGEQGKGVRLVVNELPFNSGTSSSVCLGRMMDPLANAMLPRFRPIEPGPTSFVLADKLAFCRFLFLEPALAPPGEEKWKSRWTLVNRWPMGIRIEMAPLEIDASRLQPVTVTVPLRVNRSMEIQYVD